MNRTEQNPWKQIWEKKDCAPFKEMSLQELLVIDGFDTVTGKLSVQSWLFYVESIRVKLNINEKNNILEVGCGAGAFLLPFHEKRINVYGVDFSENLIRISTNIMPSGTFKVSEAEKIPFESNMFDAVVSNGVFIYFADLGYAERVVREIARVLKKNSSAAILDINDIDKKGENESLRRNRLGDKEYHRLYGNLTHQYYRKKWFAEIARSCELRCEIQEQHISGYDNSKFRFNVFLEKIN